MANTPHTLPQDWDRLTCRSSHDPCMLEMCRRCLRKTCSLQLSRDYLHRRLSSTWAVLKRAKGQMQWLSLPLQSTGEEAENPQLSSRWLCRTLLYGCCDRCEHRAYVRHRVQGPTMLHMQDAPKHLGCARAGQGPHAGSQAVRVQPDRHHTCKMGGRAL